MSAAAAKTNSGGGGDDDTDNDNKATTTTMTLTESTTWNARVVLRGAPTRRGKKADELFSLSLQFVEEEGYEPPQGYVRQVMKEATTNAEGGGGSGGGAADRLRIRKSYWKLSEDPNDRKDGLWIWGLFEEPLYPFLLLQLETEAVPLAAGSNSDDDEKDGGGDAILPLELYAQLNHRRDADEGVVLRGNYDLKIRRKRTLKADPFGAAQVDLFDEVSAGALSIL